MAQDDQNARKVQLANYLTRKFEQMRVERGWRFSQAELARLIGVKQASLSRWMDAAQPVMPEEEGLDKIATYFRETELFSLLGYSKKVVQMKQILISWGNMTDEQRESFMQYFNEVVESTIV